VISNALQEMSQQSGSQIRAERRQKFLDIGRNL
jgi:acetyl-CoA carboxylase carboxyl transferase subunit alpha